MLSNCFQIICFDLNRRYLKIKWSPLQTLRLLIVNNRWIRNTIPFWWMRRRGTFRRRRGLNVFVIPHFMFYSFPTSLPFHPSPVQLFTWHQRPLHHRKAVKATSRDLLQTSSFVFIAWWIFRRTGAAPARVASSRWPDGCGTHAHAYIRTLNGAQWVHLSRVRDRERERVRERGRKGGSKGRGQGLAGQRYLVVPR